MARLQHTLLFTRARVGVGLAGIDLCRMGWLEPQSNQFTLKRIIKKKKHKEGSGHFIISTRMFCALALLDAEVQINK